jgi:hypothetical protein
MLFAVLSLRYEAGMLIFLKFVVKLPDSIGEGSRGLESHWVNRRPNAIAFEVSGRCSRRQLVNDSGDPIAKILRYGRIIGKVRK